MRDSWHTIAAKPTRYRGTTFRSQTEAKWAAFFDVLGMDWEYEPENLPGWLPDFRIQGPKGILLVEVRPIFGLDPARKKLQFACLRTIMPSDCIRGFLVREAPAADPVSGLYLIGEVFGYHDSTSSPSMIWGDCFLVCDRAGKMHDFWWADNDTSLLRCGAAGGGDITETPSADGAWLWRTAADRVRWPGPLPKPSV